MLNIKRLLHAKAKKKRLKRKVAICLVMQSVMENTPLTISQINKYSSILTGKVMIMMKGKVPERHYGPRNIEFTKMSVE